MMTKGKVSLGGSLGTFVVAVPPVTVGGLSLDWGFSVFTVLSKIDVGLSISSGGPVPLHSKSK